MDPKGEALLKLWKWDVPPWYTDPMYWVRHVAYIALDGRFEEFNMVDNEETLREKNEDSLVAALVSNFCEMDALCRETPPGDIRKHLSRHNSLYPRADLRQQGEFHARIAAWRRESADG